jgi:hypothetical protein
MAETIVLDSEALNALRIPAPVLAEVCRGPATTLTRSRSSTVES